MADQLPSTQSASSADASGSVQQKLALLSEHLSDALMLMDADFRVLYANPKALEISQLTAADLNHKTLWELYPGVLESELGQAYLDAVAMRQRREVRNYYYDPLKTTFDLQIFPMDGGVGVHYRDVTDLRRAETTRDATSERLAEVMDATTDGVISIARDYRITYMNRRAAEILAPSGDILNTNLWESFPSAVYPDSPFVKAYDAALFENKGSSFEAYYPEPLNSWLQIIVRPSTDGFLSFFRDITAQKQHEEALRDSEARYRVLTELSPQSQWSANTEGLVLYANRRFLDYIGHNFVPKTGKEYLDCFDERDRERVLNVWTHSVTTGDNYDIEARLLRASDGASRWWNLRALPIHDESGAIQQWLGTATDIHESRLAADRLREQYEEIDRRRRELEAIYLGSPIGMALYEPKEFRLLRINDRQAEIFGIPATEAIGKRYEELTNGVTAGHGFIYRAAAGEKILDQNIEGVLQSVPGEYRYWNVNYSPVFGENGCVQAIATATVETTSQKRAEAALIQSEKLAAVGRMASSIAHEINNPLESVTNLIYIARQYAILPEVQRHLDMADQELRRVAIIANQTLRFHKQPSNPREVTCDELFSTVIGLYQARLKNSNISVEKCKRPTRPIACFEADIRQVLNNLVGNAIDAMPTGGRIQLRHREVTDYSCDPPRNGVALTVADSGPGISQESLARIFDAFFTTKGMNGTGLGLWISKEIMERHHGRIYVRSSQAPQHHGTVFTVFLPFDAPANTAQTLQPGASDA